LISFLIFPVLIKLVSQWRLFDSPGSHKIHSDYKPSIGGIAVLIGAFFSLVLGLSLNGWMSHKYFFTSIILMALIGLRDDALALTPIQKLLSQFLPVILLVFFNQTTLNSSYGLFELPFVPIPVIWLLSIFTLVILTNAFNLIDGLDGLAGSIGLIGLASFGIWFYLAGDNSIATISLAFAGALLAFLFFNWLVPDRSQPEWVKNAKSLVVLKRTGDTLMSMLPEDPESTILKRLKRPKPDDQDQPDTPPAGRTGLAPPHNLALANPKSR